MDKMQVVVLVTSTGERLTYTGRDQIDPNNPPRVVEIIATPGVELPAGMLWEELAS